MRGIAMANYFSIETISRTRLHCTCSLIALYHRASKVPRARCPAWVLLRDFLLPLCVGCGIGNLSPNMKFNLIWSSAFRQWTHTRLCAAMLTPVILIGCAPPDDEQMIRDAIHAIAQAVEESERAELSKHLAEGFRAQEHGREVNLEQLLSVQFRGRSQARVQVHVAVSGVDIRVSGDTADVVLEVVLSQAPALVNELVPALVPRKGQAWRVDSRWQRSDRWQVTRANWWRLTD